MIEVRRRLQRIAPAGSRLRTKDLPVPLSAALPLRPAVRTPHRSSRSGPGRPARTRGGVADAPTLLRHPPRRRLRRSQPVAAFIDTWNATPLVEFDRLVETLLEWGDEIFGFHDTGGRATSGRIAPAASWPSSNESLRVRQHHQLRRQGHPPQPLCGNITMAENRRARPTSTRRTAYFTPELRPPPSARG
jgi:hypothetical protein